MAPGSHEESQRNADIEMTLTIGVHGPGKVIVFLMAYRRFMKRLYV